MEKLKAATLITFLSAWIILLGGAVTVGAFLIFPILGIVVGVLFVIGLLDFWGAMSGGQQ